MTDPKSFIIEAFRATGATVQNDAFAKFEIAVDFALEQAEPTERGITMILYTDHQGNDQNFTAGKNCERLEATTKPGEYAHIPYVRVWGKHGIVAEFCQHKLGGVFYV